MDKFIYLDTETTGLNPEEHALIEVAAVLVIDGKEVSSIALDINPFSYTRAIRITDAALEVHGLSHEELEMHSSSEHQFKEFIRWLDKYVDKYNKKDKLTIVGYNTHFDIGFLQAWFRDNRHKYYGSYFSHRDVDIFALIKLLYAFGFLPLEDLKLSTVSNYYGIDFKPHSAIQDVRALRQLAKAVIAKHIKGD